MNSNLSLLTPDFREAKAALATRLLRPTDRTRTVSRVPVFRMSAVLADATQNVHAIGVGRKEVHGKATDTTSLRVYVVQKLAASALPASARIPESFDGIPIDVIESEPSYLLSGRSVAGPPCSELRQRLQRPVMGGISAAHSDVTAGTIAGFFRSTRSGDDPAQVLVLSNNHVFANVNLGQPSDELFQPGPADGGTPGDLFARLVRFVLMHTDRKTANRVDAAVGELLQSVATKLEICSIGKITGSRRAIQDMKVRKHGRTTGYTEGIVTDESVDALVWLDGQDPSQVGLFEDQMRIEPVAPHHSIGLPGDSGSLIVEKSEPDAVGLYFAGPGSGAYGYANHIEHVLSELEIEILKE
jgi:hypothetical protein